MEVATSNIMNMLVIQHCYKIKHHFYEPIDQHLQIAKIFSFLREVTFLTRPKFAINTTHVHQTIFTLVVIDSLLLQKIWCTL